MAVRASAVTQLGSIVYVQDGDATHLASLLVAMTKALKEGSLADAPVRLIVEGHWTDSDSALRFYQMARSCKWSFQTEIHVRIVGASILLWLAGEKRLTAYGAIYRGPKHYTKEKHRNLQMIDWVLKECAVKNAGKEYYHYTVCTTHILGGTRSVVNDGELVKEFTDTGYVEGLAPPGAGGQ